MRDGIPHRTESTGTFAQTYDGSVLDALSRAAEIVVGFESKGARVDDCRVELANPSWSHTEWTIEVSYKGDILTDKDQAP